MDDGYRGDQKIISPDEYRRDKSKRFIKVAPSFVLPPPLSMQFALPPPLRLGGGSGSPWKGAPAPMPSSPLVGSQGSVLPAASSSVGPTDLWEGEEPPTSPTCLGGPLGISSCLRIPPLLLRGEWARPPTTAVPPKNAIQKRGRCPHPRMPGPAAPAHLRAIVVLCPYQRKRENFRLEMRVVFPRKAAELALRRVPHPPMDVVRGGGGA